jgi:NADH-quinone oxidoreductase subunit M
LPIYGGILIFIAMASLGLPGLSGFIAEFMVVRGALPVFTIATAVSMLGLLFTGVYVLKALNKVLQGPLNPEWRGNLAEISPREVLVVAPLMVLSLWLGIWPGWLIKVINDAVLHFFS